MAKGAIHPDLDPDVIAQTNVGLNCQKEGDLEGAEQHLTLAADKGSMIGQFSLGKLYKEQKKLVEAEKYLKLAADQGEVDAQYLLAEIFVDQGRTKDAQFYYNAACLQDHSESCYELGNLYLSQAFADKAENYYKKAENQRHMTSSYMLARLYFKQGHLFKVKEYLKIFADQKLLQEFLSFTCQKLESYFKHENGAFYQFVLKQGYVEAHLELGKLYQQQGDHSKAKEHFKLLADKGFVGAQAALVSLMHYNPVEFRGCDEEFEHYAKLAVQNGDVGSMLFLAAFYISAKRCESIEHTYQAESVCQLICPIDLEKCQSCFKEVLREAYHTATYFLPREKELAQQFFQFTADRGYRDSQILLAQLLEGKGDLEHANYYYELAAAKGLKKTNYIDYLLHLTKDNNDLKLRLLFGMAVLVAVAALKQLVNGVRVDVAVAV